MPSSSPSAALDYTPPVIGFLKQDQAPWRFTTFDRYGRKTLNANGGWPYGLPDVRGYDSIILKQSADYMGVIEDQNETQFNRIQPITKYSVLDSPMLDLLNVKYVLTDPDVTIDSPKYKLAYDAEVKVYENLGVMPRAFTLSIGCEVIARDPLAALKQVGPRSKVIVEASTQIRSAPECPLQAATITSYDLNDVTVQTNAAQPSWLVLADTYFTGWQTFDVQRDGAEKEIPISRAYGNFRAVQVGAALIS